MKKLILVVGVCILLIDALYKPPSLTIPNVSSEPPKKPEVTFTLIKTVAAAQIAAAQTSFIGTTIPTTVTQIAEYSLSYKTDGQPTSAKVYIPQGSGNYPLFVFGPGTTGLAVKCAPSLENMAVENIGNYDNHMLAQASQGYVTVMPDYAQTYFVSDNEAQIILGAITSLVEIRPTITNVFLAGYSQGGHAAMAAASQWQKLPSALKLLGVVQYAGATDVAALFLDSPWLAPYLVDSFVRHYGTDLDPQLVLQDRWLIPLAKNNAELCVNAAYAYYPHIPAKMYNPSFLDALETKAWPANLDAWQKVINLNSDFSYVPNVPYLSIQGTVDPIVTATTGRANFAKLCNQKRQVTYKEYPGVNHFQIRQASFVFSNAWMKSVSLNHLETPVSNCSN